MTTPSTPDTSAPRPSTRPGLLVEDRNAAVRRTPDGDRIVKVPSRPEEAARQGVAESAI